jgi:ceramide synthetase
VALIAFILFFVSWVLCRLLYFPLVIIRSTLAEPITLIARHHGIDPMPHYAIFNGLLLILLVLHIYW